MARHTPEGGLTWYRGSIRPYSSLWHTLSRLGSLNCLNLSQLPDRPAFSERRRTSRDTWYPLFNDSNEIDTNKIAMALGESPISMRWSHLGDVPYWFRSNFTNHLRFCQTCLSEGYHSSFYSLRLLDKCPIHGEPLFDRCSCGKTISNKLKATDFRLYAKCTCGITTFIDPENCRSPKISIEQTRALDDIASWLEELSYVIKPMPYKGERFSEIVTPVNLDVATWCDVFEIRYPENLIKPVSPCRSITRTQGGPFHDSVHKPEKDNYKIPDKYWWQESPATWTYRSICRHLRRHCATEDTRIGQDYSRPHDISSEFNKLINDPKFAAAYTEAEWAKHLDRNARERRWPYRDPWADPNQKFIGLLELFGEPSGLNYQTIASSTRTWLEYHWAAYCMLCIFSYYKDRTERIVSGRQRWLVDEPSELPKWDWAAKVRPDGSALFACVKESPSLPPARRHKLKGVRTAEQQIFDLRRAKSVQVACMGPCLTWSHQDGWTVTTAIAPDGLGFKRHKLLGSFKQRPKFWLFPASGVYIARLDTVALQVVEKSPREAISLLRNAYSQYEKTFPAAGDRSPTSTVDQK